MMRKPDARRQTLKAIPPDATDDFTLATEAEFGVPVTDEPRPTSDRRDPTWVRGINAAARTSAVVAGLVCIVMALNIAADVLMRALFNSPLPATLELTTHFWMPAIAALGLAYAQARNDQIRVTAAIDGASLGWQRAAACVGEIVTLVVVAWMLALAVDKLVVSFTIGESSLGLPWVLLWPGRLVLVIALFLFVLAVVARLVRLVIGTASIVEVESFDVD